MLENIGVPFLLILNRLRRLNEICESSIILEFPKKGFCNCIFAFKDVESRKLKNFILHASIAVVLLFALSGILLEHDRFAFIKIINIH